MVNRRKGKVRISYINNKHKLYKQINKYFLNREINETYKHYKNSLSILIKKYYFIKVLIENYLEHYEYYNKITLK